MHGDGRLITTCHTGFQQATFLSCWPGSRGRKKLWLPSKHMWLNGLFTSSPLHPPSEGPGLLLTALTHHLRAVRSALWLGFALPIRAFYLSKRLPFSGLWRETHKRVGARPWPPSGPRITENIFKPQHISFCDFLS